MDLENFMSDEYMLTESDGFNKNIDLNKFDEIRDFHGNVITADQVTAGSVVTLFDYIHAEKIIYLPMNLSGEEKAGYIIAVEKMVDVYIWDEKSSKWRFMYTGNPEEVLYDDEDLIELKKNAHDNEHPTPGIAEEGDIIFLCVHGTQKPYSDDEYPDPAGLYMIGESPNAYINDDEDDDLKLLSVYGHLKFMQDIRPKMETMVDFIIDILGLDNTDESKDE